MNNQQNTQSLRQGRENFSRAEMFERIAEDSLVGIYVVDHGQFLYVNQKMSDITGYSTDELLDENGLKRVVHPDDWPMVQENVRKRLSGEIEAIQYVFRGLTKSGEVIHVEVYGARSTLNDRQLVMGTLLDVTDRVRTAKALQQSEQQYRELTESLPQTVFEMNTDGHLTYVNPVAYTLFGYTPAEFTQGLNAQDMIAPQDHQRMLSHIEQILQGTRTNYGTEYLARRKDGTTFPVLIYTSLITLQDGRPGFRGFLADISELKTAEDALRQSEQNFRGIIHQMQEGFCRTTLDGDIVMVNPRFCEMVGLVDPADAIGQSMNTYIQDSTHFDELLERLHREQEVTNYRQTWYRMDGSALVVKANIHVVHDPSGRPHFIEGTIEDITQQVETEDQLRQVQKMEAVGQLASGIAHDFNNILTIISGYSAMLKQQLPENSPLHTAVNQITNAGENAAHLTRQLLTFSRKQPVNPKNIHVNQQLQEMLVMLRRLVDDRVTIHQDLSQDLPAIHVDPSQFTQVVMNLIINANDAIMHEGWIRLHTQVVRVTGTTGPSTLPVGRYVCVSISDNGPGMSDAVKRKVFEPFFTTKAESKGTGLGLATVYGIMQQYQGAITVESALGEGTTMLCYFPVSPYRQERQASHQHRSGAQTYQDIRILLFEAEPQLQEYLNMGLTDAGCQVHAFDSLADGLQVIDYHREAYTLCITSPDVHDATAAEIIEALMRRAIQLPVLVLGDFHSDVWTHPPDEITMVTMEKPFKIADVLDQISALVSESV